MAAIFPKVLHWYSSLQRPVVSIHSGAAVYYDTQAELFRRYEAGLAAGKHRPLLFPWDCLPALYLVLALIFVPRLAQGYAFVLRWLTMVAILSHSFYIVRVCRMTGLVGGYGIGFIFSCICIASFNFLVFTDVKTDFKRLEARPLTESHKSKKQTNGSTVPGSTSALSTGSDANGTARPRQQLKGGAGARISTTKNDAPYQFEWQAYPSSLLLCVDWVLDLLTSFRGVNWNFRLSVLPKLQHADEHQFTNPVTIVKSANSMRQVQKEALLTLACSYMAIDIIKSLYIDDAFFSGITSFYDPPGPSAIYGTDIFVSVCARLVITISSIYAALTFLFQLSPIFFSLILPSLVPYPYLLYVTRTPLLTPSMYEPFWGPFFLSMASKGIGGFWSGFWHQLIRFGISQPSIYIVKRYKFNSASNLTKTIQVLIAFCLSGFIHGLASYTSFPPVPGSTRPISGTFFFFLLQAVGIIAQGYLTRAIKSRAFPPRLRQIGNLAFAVGWLFLTGPILTEDTAKCGVWLFEPVPVSFIQGIRGQGWWRWNGLIYGWWSDPFGRWWESGYAMY